MSSGYKKAKELRDNDSGKNMQNFDTGPKSHLSANINTGHKLNLRNNRGNNQKQATLPDIHTIVNTDTGTITNTDTISFTIKKKEEEKEKKRTDQSDTSSDDDIFWIT